MLDEKYITQLLDETYVSKQLKKMRAQANQFVKTLDKKHIKKQFGKMSGQASGFAKKKLQQIKDMNELRLFRNKLESGMTRELRKNPKITIEELFETLYDQGSFDHKLTKGLTREQAIQMSQSKPFRACFDKIPKTTLQKGWDLSKSAARGVATLASLAVAGAVFVFVDLPLLATPIPTDYLFSEPFVNLTIHLFPDIRKESSFIKSIIEEAKKVQTPEISEMPTAEREEVTGAIPGHSMEESERTLESTTTRRAEVSAPLEEEHFSREIEEATRNTAETYDSSAAPQRKRPIPKNLSFSEKVRAQAEEISKEFNLAMKDIRKAPQVLTARAKKAVKGFFRGK